MSFVIAHVTDTRLSADDQALVARFRATAKALRASRSDLIVNTGDLSMSGEKAVDDLVAARRLHDAIGVPWLAVPGDHDVGDDHETPHRRRFDGESRARWLRALGADYWAHDVPGWRLLGINALLLGSDLPEAGAQVRFIAEAARTLAARKLALFLHKPLFIDDASETSFTRDALTPVVRRLLLDALGAAVPALVCCGHLLEHRERSFGRSRHVWAPGAGASADDAEAGTRVVGYVRLSLAPDGSYTTELVRLPAPQIDPSGRHDATSAKRIFQRIRAGGTASPEIA